MAKRGPFKLRDLDDEELQVLIDYHRDAARDAVDSCEHDEAVQRRTRADYLKRHLSDNRRKEPSAEQERMWANRRRGE